MVYIPNKTKTSQINQTGMKQKIGILFKAQVSVYETNMKTGFLAFVYPTANMFA